MKKKHLIYTGIIYLVILLLIPAIIIDQYKIQKEEEKKQEEKKEIEEKYEVEGKVGETIRVKLYKTGEVIAIDANDYLRGVVPSEMPPSFEMEALKAQAVVARTYLYNKINEGSSHEDAEICDNPGHCQAFYTKDKLISIWKGRGYTDEQVNEYWGRIDNAVVTTSNIVAMYNGECIKAYFHANSGGKTEDVSAIWGKKDIPYLKSVESLGEEAHQYYTSSETIKKSDFEKIVKEKVNKDYSCQNRSENLIEIVDYTNSGRVNSVKIGEDIVKAENIRTMFSLKSTNFKIEQNGDEIVFSVSGYGHGVGMSQTGANYYAKQGMKFSDIITHYYTGVEVKKINS